VLGPHELTKDLSYESNQLKRVRKVVAVVGTSLEAIEMKTQDLRVLVCLVLGALDNGTGCVHCVVGKT